MKKTVHIVASCTDRKRLAPPAALLLRNVAIKEIGARAGAWCECLGMAHKSVERLPAIEMYTGHHWSVVRNLPAVATTSGLNPALWVSSAGYGLISAGAEILPYGATFSGDSPDAVCADSEGPEKRVRACQQWWLEVNAHRPAKFLGPRSLTALAEAHPKDTIVVIGSPAYISSMSNDLLGTAQTLDSSDQLILMTSNSGDPRLSPSIVETDAAILPSLGGGSRIALNAKAAEFILRESRHQPLGAAAARSLIGGLVAAAPPVKTFDRQPMTDEQVSDFIRARVREGGPQACTPLLRALRDAGHACEQSRFRGLYRSVAETLHG